MKFKRMFLPPLFALVLISPAFAGDGLAPGAIHFFGGDQAVEDLPEKIDQALERSPQSEDLEQFRQKVKEWFSSLGAMEFLVRYVSEKAPPDVLAKIDAEIKEDWLQEIVGEVEASRSKFAAGNKREFLVGLHKAPPDQSRQRLVQRLLAATGGTERNAALEVTAFDGSHRVSNLGKGAKPEMETRVAQKNLEIMRNQLEERVRLSAQGELANEAYFTFRNIADRDLERYVEFLESPEIKRTADIVNAGVVRIMEGVFAGESFLSTGSVEEKSLSGPPSRNVASQAVLPAGVGKCEVRAVLREMVDKRDFQALEGLFQVLAAEYREDPLQEERLGDAFRFVAEKGPAYEDHLSGWVAAYPESVPARLARAEYFMNRGFAARGTRYSAQTPDGQKLQMADYHQRAFEDLDWVLSEAPWMDHGYAVFIDLLKPYGAEGRANQLQAFVQALENNPLNYEVRREMIIAALPEWGGSLEFIQKIVEEAAGHVEENPRLKGLRGAVEFAEARMVIGGLNGQSPGYKSKLRQGLAKAKSAVALSGEQNPDFMVQAGDIYGYLGENHNALNYYQKAVGLVPCDQEYMAKVAKLYRDLKQFEQAVFYADQIVANPGTEDWLKGSMLVLKGHVYALSGYYDEAVGYLEQAKQMPLKGEDADFGDKLLAQLTGFKK